MEPLPDDTKIIDLLSKLKDSNGAYPSDIFATRRQAYIKQIANAGLGIGLGAGIKNAAKSGNGAGVVTTVTSKILEAALIAAIVIEAGAVAYIYREKIADLVRTYTGSPNVQETASPSTDASSPNSDLIVPTEILSLTVTTPSGTVTATSGTPSPEVAGDNNGSNVGVNATPKPGDNNGNQYGLTPKPERTKENNDKTNDGGSGNNDSGNIKKP